jgi:DNA-binding beta-propeller fold protein YncE
MSNQSPACIPCGVRTFRRNTYFNGKLLVERDFNDEQVYLVGKDWLHNSLLHGLGTVCGLKVTAHPNPECQGMYVVIEPGVALDCCGREIIVSDKVLVPLLDLISAEEVTVDATGTYDLFISLCYQEVLEEKIPVILPDCDCADANQAYNRIRESYKLHLFSQPAGARPPVQPPLNARLDWLHTITLPRQSPRAVAVDDQLQQLYIAIQAIAPDEEETDLQARLYAFRTDTHDLITAVNGGSAPTDLALSLLGDRIYLATTMLQGEGDAGPVIAVYREASIRAQPEPANTIPLDGPARLVVSPLTGALFALVLDNGAGQAQLLRWADDAIRDWLNGVTPSLTPNGTLTFDSTLDGRNGATMVTMTLDGRYLFIADATTNSLRVVEVATFTELTPAVTSHGQPLAVATSRDSTFLYVLWAGAGGNAGQALLSRYELDTSLGSLLLREDGRGGRWPGTPIDLSLAPNERWAYVLQVSDDGQGQVQAVDIDQIAGPGAEPVDARGTREPVSGAVRFQRLAVLGSRLYVAAEDEATNIQPERGLVAILNVEEAACDDVFTQALEGCPACNNGEGENHCVVVAHLPKYRQGARVKNASDASADDVMIDNLTHRQLVPSTTNIVEVIRCMLEQGLAEGVPGPRGPAGEQGLHGETGPRGPGITAVMVSTLEAGSSATATLEPIAGDPEGDQRLQLNVPRGDTGVRGPGITAVTVTTLAAGSSATATLEPIAGDPEGDQRLQLGIPRGEQGPPGPGDDPTLTHIVGLSWAHNATLTVNAMQHLLIDPNLSNVTDPRRDGLGLVIAFDNEVNIGTILQPADPENPQAPLTSEVFQLFARVLDRQQGLLCECLIPEARYQPVEVTSVEDTGRITEIVPRPGLESAKAVRLVFDGVPPVFDTTQLFLRVVFRADFALDTNGSAVDGNNIGGLVPQRPSGNGRQGDDFISWFFAMNVD